MSKILKAFATHDLFVDNNRLKESPFGELSTYSRTYEKDVRSYTSASNRNITLNVFKFKDSDSDVVDVNNEPPSDIVKIAQDVSEHIYNYVTKSAREIFRDELSRNILDKLRDRIHSIDLGEVITDGKFYCVEYCRFMDSNDNDYIIWFSDKSFQAEYDDHTILVVPPVKNYDIFFANRATIIEELEKKSIVELTREANARKGNSPETVFRIDVFKMYNPVTKLPDLDTNWYVLIWGESGDNIDSIQDAIQEDILKNSTHTREEWKEIFPEIFKRNEFIIVPQWDVFSNENKVRDKASLYSPAMNYRDVIPKYAIPFMNEMREEHILDNAQITSFYFRSICAVSCGSEENRDGKFKITDIFPDFIDVPSTSTDFNYQTKKTQKWSVKINEMLSYAEEMTPTSILPREKITLPGGEIIPGDRPYGRVIRNNITYITMRYERFNYLIVIKYNFTNKKKSNDSDEE